MSYNTNTKIPMSKTASLSDAHFMAEETWGEVGNYPLNNFSSIKRFDINMLNRTIKKFFFIMPYIRIIFFVH